MAISSDEYRQMMRLYPAAVTIITTGSKPNRAGLTATAVMSLSTDPVRVVCAINQASNTYARIAENKSFSVNTLTQDQIPLAKAFSGQTSLSGEARFAGDDWTTLESGAPVLKGALMTLDCELIECIDAGTHALIIGKIVAGKRAPDLSPLIYVDGNWAGVDMRLVHA
jgi:flavin reductase (DIM6/NTAB) family NADH-FMN oxidoreductase RutF